MNFKQKVYTILDSSSANLHAIDKGQAVKTITAESTAADLQYLDQKLAAISKDIQVLDVLTITSAVSSYEEYLNAVNLLVNGQGISIANSFENFNTGDIVYKINNQLAHLSFAASGYYYPSQLTKKDSGYTFTYSYQESIGTPSGDETIIEKDGTWIAQETNKAQYIYKDLQAVDVKHVLTYDEYITPSKDQKENGITFEIKKYKEGTEEKVIMPLIKMFHMVNNYQEQIECEFNLTKDDTNWTISGFPDFVSLVTVR